MNSLGTVRKSPHAFGATLELWNPSQAVNYLLKLGTPSPVIARSDDHVIDRHVAHLSAFCLRYMDQFLLKVDSLGSPLHSKARIRRETLQNGRVWEKRVHEFFV